MSDNAMEWLKEHWVKVLMIFIGVFLALGIIWGLVSLFNGPFGNAFSDLLGAGSNLINGLVNGCTSQADCSKPTQKEDCVKSNGCSWDTGDDTTKPATKPSCFNSTGRSPGSGSFFSTSCLLGMGAIAYLALLLIGPLLKGLVYMFGGAKDVVKDTSRLNGESLPDTMEKMTKDAHRLTERAIEKLKEAGHEITPEFKNAVARSAVAQSAYNKLIEAAEGSSQVPEAERNAMAESAATTRAERIDAEHKANTEALGADKADAIKKAVEDSDPSRKPPEPGPEK